MALAYGQADEFAREPRWIVLLRTPSIAEQMTAPAALPLIAAETAKAAIAREHQGLRRMMVGRGLRVTGSSDLLLNALFVTGEAANAESLRSHPDVEGVVRVRYHRKLADDRATQIVNTPAGWQLLGGEGNAGAGRRIGIIDSGVDVTHPALQDSSLTPPPGFPRVSREADRSFTSSKVIVARSYVDLLGSTDPLFSRPDDRSARDRDGHGTAIAMLAAGRRVTAPGATIVGVAPKAFIGNYKVFGSPGLNDSASDDAVIAALQDAVRDGMDVVTLSLGYAAEFGALDTCGSANNRRPCDPLASAIENAARLNVAVVVAAGNSGDSGFNLPTLGSIQSPGTAPAAITVGAITNAHIYYQSVRLSGGTVPPALQRLNTRFGDGPVPNQPVTAPLRDVAQLGDDGKACRPLGNGTLAGAIALIDRGGDCSRESKVNHAQRAGAVGVVLVQLDGFNSVFPMQGLQATGIPAVLIGSGDGRALRSYLLQSPGARVTLDPAVVQVDAPADEIAYFSSQGPAIGDFNIKPELTAVGTDLYLATQDFDPNSGLFSADRYRAVQGTSFAVPLVAGTVALVKQRSPNWTPLQLKSAVVNSANPNIDDFDGNNRRVRARVNATGAGKLDVAAALRTNLTADPATLSFGVYSGTSKSIGLRLTNHSTTAATLTAQIQARDADASARLTVTPSNFSISPGQTTQLSLVLSGARPAAGNYEGVISISGGGTTLRIPYLYLVGDGVPFNIYSLVGNPFFGTPNQGLNDPNRQPRMALKILDKFGVPVEGQPLVWSAVSGGGRIETVSTNSRTDDYGISEAYVSLGASLGEQAFRVTAGALTQVFDGRTIPVPVINSNGVTDAAAFIASRPVAPGSYITIKGAGLSELTRVYNTPSLPVSLSNVSVTFDSPDRRISEPGRLHFVSEGQINVQVPWEFSNQTVARMKVINNGIRTAVVDIPLAEFAPGFFEFDDATSGRRVVAALDVNYGLLNSANPAERGKTIALFLNGLGRVTNTPASGEPSRVPPLSETLTKPTVTIGGRPASVSFAGLTPDSVGLYQVNVIVPEDAPTGVQPVKLSIGGVDSQTSQLFVR